MASYPCAGAFANLITVVVSPIPRYANIGSILPNYYISSKGENSGMISMCASHINFIMAFNSTSKLS